MINLHQDSGKVNTLKYIMRYKECSRKTIAASLGLTRASISMITSELIKKEYVEECGEQEQKVVGRREVMLRIKAGQAFAIGIDISLHSAAVSVLDLDTSVLDYTDYNYDVLTIQQLEVILKEALRLKGIYANRRFLGAGIAAQGYIKNNECLSIPIHDIKSRVEQALGIKCSLMNNVKAMAFAEQFLGDAPQNFMFLKYGPGVGSALVVDGKMLEGENGSAGEIGHILWNRNSMNTCPICGKHGCLESLINVRTIERSGDWVYAFGELALAVSHAVALVAPEKLYLAGEIFQEESYVNMMMDQLETMECTLNRDNILVVEDYKKKRRMAAGLLVLAGKM